MKEEEKRKLEKELSKVTIDPDELKKLSRDTAEKLSELTKTVTKILRE